MRLNQVTLAVTDLGRSVDFYRRLGLEQIVADERYARFVCPDGDSTFSLERLEAVPPSATIVYFECEDLDATVAALEAEGIHFEPDPWTSPGCGAKPVCAIRTATGCACSKPARTGSIRRGAFLLSRAPPACSASGGRPRCTATRATGAGDDRLTLPEPSSAGRHCTVTAAGRANLLW